MECKHFGLCGGCRCKAGSSGQARPAPYDEELGQKARLVRELLARYDVGEWRPIVPSPQEWHYRNKMEYAFAVPYSEQQAASSKLEKDFPGLPLAARGSLVLGLREAGRYDRVVDLETCGLMSDEAVEVLKRVRRWALDKELRGYHRRKHEGDLRYLVIREGKNTGDRMGILIANTTIKKMIPSPLEGEGADGGADASNVPPTSILPLKGGGNLLDSLHSQIGSLLSTCWLGITDSQSDVARADDMRLLWGPGAITEKLISRTYRISPYSFFQTNTHGTEKLYALIQEWGAAVGGTLIDLYCGSGGITLALADHFDRVVGIDTNADAIEDAKKAAQDNGLHNTEFVCEDALEFLKKLPGSKLSVQLSALAVDPPRAGLPPKALQALLEMNPPHVAYVSCNPESLARDLQGLVPFYRISGVQPVDLFPHTAHVETLVFLEHR